jgi:hypothetical protein
MRSQMLSAPARGARPSASADEITRRLSTASIVSLAIGMSIAINGLVLFLIGGRPLDFYGFAVVSLLALAVYFPGSPSGGMGERFGPEGEARSVSLGHRGQRRLAVEHGQAVSDGQRRHGDAGLE